MKNDIIDVMEACVDGTLDTIDLQFEDNACVCVVLASDGYPVKYEKGFKITGFEKFDGKEDYYCYHAAPNLMMKEISSQTEDVCLVLLQQALHSRRPEPRLTRQQSGYSLIINT